MSSIANTLLSATNDAQERAVKDVRATRCLVVEDVAEQFKWLSKTTNLTLVEYQVALAMAFENTITDFYSAYVGEKNAQVAMDFAAKSGGQYLAKIVLERLALTAKTNPSEGDGGVNAAGRRLGPGDKAGNFPDGTSLRRPISNDEAAKRKNEALMREIRSGFTSNAKPWDR